jgi:glycosyltransferase involved in cell wall biosynthesis
MKLIIQIPCYNEAATLGVALAELPRHVPGFDVVEWMVIDDGSTDETSAEAKAHGVEHVVRFPSHRGLAKGFMAGLDACIARGADVIVNTDADNQYNAADIPKLVQPILDGRAEMVIGARPISSTMHFSPVKKLLQKLGSWMVRKVSGTTVEDAPSGFRAISRKAAMQLNVYNEYTYTLETIIQSGHKGIAVTSVPIRTNPDLRPSRLVRSIRAYVQRSMITIFRIFMVYRPFRFFAWMGSIPFMIGFIIGARFVIHYFAGEGSGKIQSLLLATLLMGMGFMLFVVALLADLIAVNRKLLEKLDWRMRMLEAAQSEDKK